LEVGCSTFGFAITGEIMPSYTANVIVLRRINFGETDRIVTLYSRERGKISGIAKGARKPVSRLAGATEVLTSSRLRLAIRKALNIISQAEIKESFPRIHTDLKRLSYAGYLAELVDKFVEEHEVSIDIFDLLLSALYLLERPNDPEKITHMFELQFMCLMGYEPRLDKCLRCLAHPSSDELYFSPSMGGLVCRECGPLPEDAIQVMPETVEALERLLTAEAPDVERMEIPKEVMDQIARVMRWYIRYHSGRELKSLDFIQTLRHSE